MDMSATVVSTANLKLGYGDKTILTEVSASVHAGTITCIVGPSGCGKSTFLKSLIGLLPPMEGNVSLLDSDLYTLDEGARNGLLGEIGVLFQNGALLGSMTVGENILIPLRERGRIPEKVLRQTSLLMLRQVGLEHAVDLMPSELSGGMRKRAALAWSLVLDPKILFCDEPSAGLDPVTAAQLDELLLNLRRVLGITIVVVTHELASIETIADEIIMLGQGGLKYQGTFAAAKTSGDPEMDAFFGREANTGPQRGSLLKALEEASTW